LKHLLFPLLLLAAEAAAQPADARSCASCHGTRGEGGLTGAPPLAGLPQGYLARQLAAYADGSRQHSVMTPIAQRLTPQEREALDAYYSGLPAPLVPPQIGGYKANDLLARRRRRDVTKVTRGPRVKKLFREAMVFRGPGS
jgi:cytochrome c553